MRLHALEFYNDVLECDILLRFLLGTKQELSNQGTGTTSTVFCSLFPPPPPVYDTHLLLDAYWNFRMCLHVLRFSAVATTTKQKQMNKQPGLLSIIYIYPPLVSVSVVVKGLSSNPDPATYDCAALGKIKPLCSSVSLMQNLYANNIGYFVRQ